MTKFNNNTQIYLIKFSDPKYSCGGRHGGDRTIVGFATTCAISVYHHYCEFEAHS